MRKITLIIIPIIFLIIACQTTDNTGDEAIADQEIKSEATEVIDSLDAEAIFMKVSSPDEILVELKESIGMDEKIGTYISVDQDNELLITHLRHEGQHHLMFDQASLTLPLTLFYNNTEDIEPLFRVSIRHRVKDYATWKWLYDGDQKSRENAGMVLVQMGCIKGDPNDLFMVFGIPDIARAREMMDKPNLKNKMKSGGVIGDPDVRFWRPVSND